MPEDPIPFSRLAEKLIGEFRGVPFNEPARMRKRPTTPLASVVEELLVKHRIGRASPEDALRERWSELVGPANASYSHAAQIDARGRVVILAAHAVVRHELFLHRQTILARIRAVPGCGHVREIIIRAG